MSNNTWVNYAIGAVVGIVIGIATWGVGLAAYAGTVGLFAFAGTSAYLNARYATPRQNAGLGVGAFGNAGATQRREDAAAGQLQISSASESIAIPVAFGTVRVGSNFLRYDGFRAVPIIMRFQRDPAAVALEQSKKAYARNSSKADHELDKYAKSQQGGGGGKGGSSSPPPPSSGSRDDRINQYAQVLLAKDQSGKKKLPTEYDEVITGYNYFLTFDLGFCCGPIDALISLRSYPGETLVAVPADGEFTTNEMVLTGAGADEGGTIRMYRGSDDQTRNVADPHATAATNYRHTCFGVWQDYKIGQSTAPKSYVAEVQRMPVVLDANGDPVSDFPTRGSILPDELDVDAAAWSAGTATVDVEAHGYEVGDEILLAGFEPIGWNGFKTITAVTADDFSFATTDPGAATVLGTAQATPHSSYYDANPAAILWELFTNDIWGRGMSADFLDVVSFRQAANYFATNNLGMSFTLETQSGLGEAVETIRNHVQTIVVWSDGKLKCRCLMDRENAYSPHVIVSAEQITGLKVTRPAWPATINELRVEFQNRENNYQNEVALVHDLGNMATVGRVNSQKMSLPAFSTRDVAERMAARILSEMAYPSAACQFTMNRFASKLEPGDFFELRTEDYTTAGSVLHSFWRVATMEDGEMDDEGIIVTGVEDRLATPYEGDTVPFVAPTSPYEGLVSNGVGDLYLDNDKSAAIDPGEMTFLVKELPMWLSDGDGFLAVFAQRAVGSVTGLNVYWRQEGTTDDFQLAGALMPWAILGTLQTNVTANPADASTRDAGIVIELDQASDRAKFLEWASTAPTAADHLDGILASETNWLLLGNEIIGVAQATAGDQANRVECTGVIRGLWGTTMETHAAGARAAFIFQFIPQAYSLRTDLMPIGEGIEFKAVPYTTQGVTTTEYTFGLAELTNRSRKPMAVAAVLAVSVVGDDWTVTFRPRFHNRGDSTYGELEADLGAFTGEIPEGYEFFVMPLDVADNELESSPVLLAPTFTPDDLDGDEEDDGTCVFVYTAPTDTVQLVLYQAFNGIIGEPTTIIE